MKEYDAIIIGSGQGGAPLAHKLADLDWKVAFIERHYWGGPASTMAARQPRR